MKLAYAIAWLLPIVFGSGLVAAAQGRPRSLHAWAAMLGCGTLLGLLLTGVGVGMLGNIDVIRILPLLGSVLGLIAVAVWLFVWRVGSADRSRWIAPHRFGALSLVLLLLLLAHAWLIAIEVLLRPPYPWDAWAIWLLKPKAWLLSGHIGDYVDYATWLADGSGRLRTAAAWNYPELIPNLATWFASAWGEWNGIAVDVAWLALWGALLVGSYGQLRSLGLARDRAMIAVYALGSLPLIDVHAALAGYADLWIAAVLAFACLFWMRWLIERRPGELALALLFASTLPMIKLEGAVWLLLFVGMVGYVHLPPSLRMIARIALPVSAIVLLLAYLLHWPVFDPILARVGAAADTGALLAHAPAVVASTVIGMFMQYNWHLFWFAALLTLALRWRVIAATDELRALGVFLLLGCMFLFIIFVLTPAGRWAESYTAVNRLTLQIVPSALLFVALSWRDASMPIVARETSPAPVASLR